MRLGIVAFAVGVWLLQQQAELPDTRAAWALAALALIAPARLPSARALRAARRVVLLAACCAAGYAWAACLAQMRLADALPAGWEGRDIRLEGVVAALPHSTDRSVRFEFAVERILTGGATVPARIVLSWWGSPARDDRPATVPELAAGERWRLTVRLKRPHGLANPHGFDYEAWLIERNLRATGYVRLNGDNRRVAALVHRPAYWVERLRGLLRARIVDALPEEPYAGVLVALAVGDQRAIPPEQWEVYTRTGVNHLMSISGLHVTMVSGLAFALAGALWRRSPQLALRLPAVKAAALAGVATAFAYALLAGFAVPAQRTVYMLTVVAVALWAGVLESASLVLAVALFVVLLLDPWAVLAPGFWLSFGAVAVIMYVCTGRIGPAHWLQGWARVQWAVTLALIPVLLAVFHQFSVVSPVANALAIPVIGLAVVPSTLLGVALPVDWLLRLAHEILAWCMFVLERLASLDAAVWTGRAPPPWAVAAGIGGTLLMLAPRGIPARWLGAAGFLPLLAVKPAVLEPGALELTVLDVGQGVAAVVRTATHALIYDAGPAFGPQADSGTRVIVPWLRAAGVARLDTLIVSHDDADHWGGAASVLRAVPVGRLLTSLPAVDPLYFQSDRPVPCRAGQQWAWDEVRFEILHPAPESYDAAPARDNDMSCVLRVTAPGVRLLLPGDIEKSAERELTARHGTDLFADVLLAPHQGSRTSSTPAFLAAVRPHLVVFPVGYRNRFAHPHREVVRRYEALGSRIYRTDRDGAVTIRAGRDGRFAVTPHRAAYRRYWHTALIGNPVPAPEEFEVRRALAAVNPPGLPRP